MSILHVTSERNQELCNEKKLKTGPEVNIYGANVSEFFKNLGNVIECILLDRNILPLKITWLPRDTYISVLARQWQILDSHGSAR